MSTPDTRLQAFAANMPASVRTPTERELVAIAAAFKAERDALATALTDLLGWAHVTKPTGFALANGAQKDVDAARAALAQVQR